MFGARAFRCWLACVALLAVVLGSRVALAGGSYVSLRIEGVINPIKARLVERAVQEARAQHAELLLVSLDTPGGLVTSMQEIVALLTNSTVPVVTFVGPSSAQASSAGAFILLAGDLAAMAPGTRVGAAHPVGEGGAELKGPINDKVTNSLTSLIRSLAERRGRPISEAEAMVQKSTSYTAEQARDAKLIELVASDEGALLAALDGRKLENRTLNTNALVRVSVAPSAFERFVDRLADPTLTSLLLSLGVLGLIYELATPGIGAGGVVGALLLVLGLLGSSVLPIELSAVALLLLGVAAAVLEIKLPTHGIVGAAGVIAMLIGGLLLVDPGDYFGGAAKVQASVFLPVVGATGLALLLLVRAARKAMAAPLLTGVEALVGQVGSANTSFGPGAPEQTGIVLVDGARWKAESPDAQIASGQRVRVVSVTTKPTRLIVRRES